jgi:hypothetical protein
VNSRAGTSQQLSVIATLTVMLLAHAALSLPSLVAASEPLDANRPSTVKAATRATPEQFRKYQQWSALQIMREVQRRHEQFPYVYEEQTMVLTDAQGNRSIRQCRRFSRTEEDGSAKFLLIFDHPEEIRGVALLALRDAQGDTERGVYLPAFGAEFKRPTTGTRSGHFLGTDFSVEDLIPETLDEHRYGRDRDRIRDDVEIFVIVAYPANAQVARSSGYGLRRHWIRKDNFMIVQTDFFDRHQRFIKRITHHDLKHVSAQSWRANMIVVSDQREMHQTLLKIDRRIYSRDYVPAEIFDRDFLLANGHLRSLGDRIAGRTLRAPKSAATNKAESESFRRPAGKASGTTIIERSAATKGAP